MIKITGIIRKVNDAQTFNTFTKRTFWIEDVSDKYPNTYELETWKNDCEMLDKCKVDDIITAYIDLKGKQYTGRDGVDRVINSFKCWNIEKDGILEKEI